jgi:hypothetical protein
VHVSEGDPILGTVIAKASGNKATPGVAVVVHGDER